MMTASDYQVKCTDKLDCACKVHDIDVFERGGRTRSSDTRLSKVALKISLDPRNPRSLRKIARFVGIGMLLGRVPR